MLQIDSKHIQTTTGIIPTELSAHNKKKTHEINCRIQFGLRVACHLSTTTINYIRSFKLAEFTYTFKATLAISWKMRNWIKFHNNDCTEYIESNFGAIDTNFRWNIMKFESKIVFCPVIFPYKRYFNQNNGSFESKLKRAKCWMHESVSVIIKFLLEYASKIFGSKIKTVVSFYSWVILFYFHSVPNTGNL